MPRGTDVPRIGHLLIRMVETFREAFWACSQTVERDCVTRRVYGVVRKVADCFKHRNRIGLDVALEALRGTRAKNKASSDELWRYAKACLVAQVMLPDLLSIGRTLPETVT